MNEAVNSEKGFGVNVWWTIPTFKMEAEKVQGLLEKHGFDRDDMKAPSDRVEVSRAVRSFQNRRTKDNRRLAELARTNGGDVVYGILDRRVDGDDVEFVQSTTVKYDRNHNTVSVSGSLFGEVNSALEEYKDKITDADLRNFVRGVIGMCRGIAKRPSGGIYFVPSQFASVVEQASGFLAELKVGAKLYVERMMNGVQEREIVWEAVEDDIDEQLAKVMSGVERVERRVSALRNGEEKIEELRGLMVTYQELLGQEAKHEELAEKLDKAVKSIADKMSKMQLDTLEDSTVGDDEKMTIVNLPGTFDEAVKAVLRMSDSPMSMEEIIGQMNSNGFTGEKPKAIVGYFNYRVKNGELVRASRGKYILPEKVVTTVAPVEDIKVELEDREYLELAAM
jgi:hypothetical protein